MIKTRPALFKCRHFEPEVIVCAVRWYLRFSLSYRDVEALEVGLRQRRVSRNYEDHFSYMPCSVPRWTE
jgi:transposase-like protein